MHKAVSNNLTQKKYANNYGKVANNAAKKAMSLYSIYQSSQSVAADNLAFFNAVSIAYQRIIDYYKKNLL